MLQIHLVHVCPAGITDRDVFRVAPCGHCRTWGISCQLTVTVAMSEQQLSAISLQPYTYSSHDRVTLIKTNTHKGIHTHTQTQTINHTELCAYLSHSLGVLQFSMI